MFTKVHFPKGIAHKFDINGNKVPVEHICVDDCNSCPTKTCQEAVIYINDPNNANTVLAIDLAALAAAMPGIVTSITTD